MSSSLASSFLQRRLSFDAACVLVSVTGCLSFLIEADRRGRAPLRGSLPARDGNAGDRKFSPKQCRQLERDGYLVMDNFLTPQQVTTARRAIQVLDANRQFRPSPDDAEDDHNNSNNKSSPSNETRTRDRALISRSGVLDSIVRQSIGEFAASLAHSDFQGFPLGSDGKERPYKDAYKKRNLHMPAQMQINICGGLIGGGGRASDDDNDDQLSSAGGTVIKPSTHNFYFKHLDSAGANHIGELGLIGWLRSQHLRQRYLTCIVYLNPDWKEDDGGCLRLYHNNAANNKDHRQAGDSKEVVRYSDIHPLSGRMVVFSSSSQMHAVLPTKVQRYACAVWLALK